MTTDTQHLLTRFDAFCATQAAQPDWPYPGDRYIDSRAAADARERWWAAQPDDAAVTAARRLLRERAAAWQALPAAEQLLTIYGATRSHDHA